MNPFHLDGGFNGDGAMDVALLIKERATGKHGIAVVHGTTGKITIVGAPTAAMISTRWIPGRVTPKRVRAHAVGETSVPHLRGNALLVEKSESGSALIYWNGKRYLWPQRGV